MVDKIILDQQNNNLLHLLTEYERLEEVTFVLNLFKK